MPEDFPPLSWITPVYIGGYSTVAPSDGGGGEEDLGFYLFGEDGAPLLSPTDSALLQGES